MRRLKGMPIKSSLNPLAVGVGITNVIAFPGVVVPTRAESPPAMVTAGNTALAVDYQTEVEPLEEPAEERGVGGRPEGVSDQVLYESWLRLHTPYASVAGTKRKGVTRRVNVATSGIHKPKAYSPFLNQTVQHPSAHVVGMQEMLNGLLHSAESRYLSDHKRVQEFVDPRAEKYVYDRHLEKVEVWFPLIAMYQQAAEVSHSNYDFKMNLEYRRLERDDIPVQGPQGPTAFVGPVKPAANDDASVEAVATPYVGPIEKLQCINDIPARSWDDWYNIKQRKYAARQRELEEAFNAYDYKQNTQSSKYTLPEGLLSTHEGVPERSYMAYKNTQEHYRKRREAEYTRLFDEEDRRKKEVRMLAETYVKFVKHKWSASPEFMLKMQTAFDEQVSNPRVQSQVSRAQRYRYKLRALRSKNVHTRSYEAVPFATFVSLYGEGHDLPGNVQKAVVTLGKQRPATVWSNQALSRVFSKVVAAVNDAKAMIRTEVVNAKRIIFGEVEYTLTNGGVLLPVNLVELPMEPGW